VWAKSEVGLKHLVVAKVGGSLIRKPQDLEVVSKILSEKILEQGLAAVVVSAVKGVTDLLISACSGDKKALEEVVETHRSFAEYTGLKSGYGDQLLSFEEELARYGEACVRDPMARDRVLSVGERFSTIALASSLENRGHRVRVAWPWEVGLLTDDRFGDASPLVDVSLSNMAASISRILYEGYVAVIPGFIGVTAGGSITTMGRGSSDLTAVLVARAIDSPRLYLLTETPGILTADPKVVPNAITVEAMDYSEGVRASKYRVKGLNRKTFEYVGDYGGEILVLDLSMRGTRICRACKRLGVKVIAPFDTGASLIGWGSDATAIKISQSLGVDGYTIGYHDDLEAIIYSEVDPNTLVRSIHREVFGL